MVTEGAINAASRPGQILSAVTGTAESLGEERLAGPIGLAKLGIDATIYTAAAAYCYANIP